MARKGLVLFGKLGSTFDLDREIASANAINPIGDLSMEEVRTIDIEPLAILLTDGRSGGARGTVGGLTKPPV